jgi:hypothetical protein
MGILYPTSYREMALNRLGRSVYWPFPMARQWPDWYSRAEGTADTAPTRPFTHKWRSTGVSFLLLLTGAVFCTISFETARNETPHSHVSKLGLYLSACRTEGVVCTVGVSEPSVSEMARWIPTVADRQTSWSLFLSGTTCFFLADFCRHTCTTFTCLKICGAIHARGTDKRVEGFREPPIVGRRRMSNVIEDAL